MESINQIEEQAAAWLARRDGGDWTERDAASLSAWLEASTLRHVSFLRLEAAWEESLRLKALAAGIGPGAGATTEWRLAPLLDRRQPMPDSPRVFRRRSTIKQVALAASVLMAVGAAYYFGADWLSGDRYTTPVGGMASVPLQDGSNVLLNTASKIRVELNAQERHIDLTQGEAFFDVARDATRPFVVSAGKKRVIAVGTKFSVRRDTGGVRVIVTEGKVRIEDMDDQLLVDAGSMARAEPSGVVVQKKTLPETEALLSWRTGYLTFIDTPLGEAVAEFNQYSRQQIVIVDPDIATMPLWGRFRATNYEAFLRLLTDYSVDVHRDGDRIVLSHQ